MDSTKSWTKIEKLVVELGKKISSKQSFDSIFTISRGGLVPARLVADYLGIQKIYVDSKKIPPCSLIVDDIYDTGKTFSSIVKKTKKPESLVYATLFARIGKRYPKQLIYAEKTKGDEYIVFPWEKFEQKN